MQPTIITILLGLIFPPIMGLVTRFIKDSDARFWVSILLCLGLGVLVNFVEMNGDYSGMMMKDIIYSILGSGLDLIALSKVSYEAFWDNSNIGKALPDKLINGEQSPMEVMNLKPNTK